MRFIRDRRGQSVVVGTVILFGFLILALSLYQVQVVPQENSNVEFEHSQQVEGEFLDLRNSVLSASRTGDGRSTSLKLGTRYPQRTFSLNPPPASGELSTTESNELRIENATVDGDENVVNYWNNRTERDGAIAFDTRSLRYSPGYNEFRNGPDLVYEHSLVLAEFETAALGRSGQTAVDSDRDRIRLTALDGDVDEFGVERVGLDPETLSQSQNSVQVSATGGDPVVLELPTDVSMEQSDDLEDQWRDRLGDDVQDVTVADGTVRIELSGTESYRLELGKVGLGTGASAPDESTGYIKKVSTNNGVAVAEVRDRFNNPVENAEVTIVVDGTELPTERTDEDGRVEYEATDPPEDVDFTINENDEEWESVRFEDLGVGTDGGAGEGNRTFNVNWLNQEPVTVVEGGDSAELNVEVTDRDRGERIRDSTIDYSFSSLQDGGLPSLGKQRSPDENDGTDTVTFDPNEADAGDEFDVYASAGDDVDDIRVEIIDEPEPPENAELNVEQFTIDDTTSDETFTVDITVEETANVETENLEVALAVESPDGQNVYNELITPGEIQDGTATVTFGVDGGTEELGTFDADGEEYTATATANADNADPASASDTFSVDEQSGTATNVQFVEGTAETTAQANSRVGFRLVNNGDESVTIIRIGVRETSDENAVSIIGSGGDPTVQAEEVRTLYTDRIIIGDDPVTLTQSETIASGEELFLEIGQFRDTLTATGNSNRQNMNGDEITIEIGFPDGSVRTIRITP